MQISKKSEVKPHQVYPEEEKRTSSTMFVCWTEVDASLPGGWNEAEQEHCFIFMDCQFKSSFITSIPLLILSWSDVYINSSRAQPIRSSLNFNQPIIPVSACTNKSS